MAELKGKHVLGVAVSFFGVIIAVNLIMAYQAISTFPGLEVANGYVASQTFDAERKAQEALGWTVATDYTGGTLSLRVTDAEGLPAVVESMAVLVGRTTESRQDMRPDFVRVAGVWQADVPLARGKWMLVVEAEAQDGTKFKQRLELFVMDEAQG
jgi:nitrogen fixation protein FixH